MKSALCSPSLLSSPVEGLAARPALVRLLVGVDDLVPAQRRRLAEALPAHLADERAGAWIEGGKVRVARYRESIILSYDYYTGTKSREE